MGHRTARTSLTHKLKSKRSARIGIGILIWGMLALITEAQYEPRSAVVERVIDGDTIEVRVDDQTHTVRLIGADTPETKHPAKEVQYFGQEAIAFTKAALEGKTVQLQIDRHVGPLRAAVAVRPPGRRQLQRPAHPRGLRPCLPAVSLLEANGVY